MLPYVGGPASRCLLQQLQQRLQFSRLIRYQAGLSQLFRRRVSGARNRAPASGRNGYTSSVFGCPSRPWTGRSSGNRRGSGPAPASSLLGTPCPRTGWGPRNSPPVPADGPLCLPVPAEALQVGTQRVGARVRAALRGPGRSGKRVWLPIRWSRSSQRSLNQPSHGSRGLPWNTPVCQPASAIYWRRHSAMYRSPRPADCWKPRS